jgi:hypothetical protein
MSPGQGKGKAFIGSRHTPSWEEHHLFVKRKSELFATNRKLGRRESGGLFPANLIGYFCDDQIMWRYLCITNNCRQSPEGARLAHSVLAFIRVVSKEPLAK